ncbi:ABC transporter permease [Segnochrobactraceae bacterium EtOH-i3]
MKVLSALDRLDVVVAALAATSLVLPAVPTAMTAPVPEAVGLPAVPSLCLAAAALLRVRLARDSGASALAGVIGLGLGAIGPLSWLGLGVSLGGNTPAVFLLLAALVLFAASVMAGLADLADRPGAPAALSLGAPFVFGAALLYLWQVAVIGFGVPKVLLPAPTAILAALVAQAPVLWGDFVQTVLKATLAGYIIGNGAGFLTALLVDRSPFLRRGLMPLGGFVSAVPIVGVAPILVMWFGFDWQSKAAVVVVMTFFPAFINACVGLSQSSAIDRDLMRAYAATYAQDLRKLRLPNAAPFLFNALKLNAPLALIGAIVAEFFGSPTAGLGFRISVEVARMNVDVVWAAIAVAAVTGSAIFGGLVLLERALTFWHPSIRR